MKSGLPMSIALKRHFWFVDLTFLSGAASLCALIVGTLYVHSSHLPPSSLKETAGSPQIERIRPILEADVISRTMNILDRPVEALPEEAILASLSVRLWGTLVSNIPGLSLATLEDLKNHETSLLGVGDTVQGATILSIDRGRVFVENQGRREVLLLEDDTTKTRPMRVTSPVVTQSGQNSFVVDRHTVVSLADNPVPEIGKMLWTPAVRDGVSIGWKLARLAPDAMLGKLGFAQGDVVRRVDGFEVNDPSKLLETLMRLRSANQVNVEIDRNGASQQLTYQVRG
jgi:general secretion pathway protein C